MPPSITFTGRPRRESFSAALYVTFKLKDETGNKKERVYMGEHARSDRDQARHGHHGTI